MTREELLPIAKPVLFNTEMVIAILEDRKTVTRRVVKFLDGKNPNWTGYIKDGLTLYNGTNEPCNKKPPFQKGDYLYVRETWQEVFETEYNIDGYGGCKNIRELISNFDEVPKVCVGLSTECKFPLREPRNKYYVYKASNIRFFDKGLWWKPSIHMPKEAARLFLKVKDVRAEQLQECGKGWCLDIEKEGVVTPQAPILYVNDDKFHEAMREEFHKLWNSTIKKADLDKYGWDANPWVWVIEFERVEVE